MPGILLFIGSLYGHITGNGVVLTDDDGNNLLAR